MARGRKRDPRILAAVEEMLLMMEPPGRIRAVIAKRYKIGPRTVTRYIARCDATRAEEERVHARHRRPRALATASAALARALTRALRLADEADDLLDKAAKYESQVHKALEAGDIDDLNSPSGGGETKLQIDGAEVKVDEPTSPERKREQTRLRSKAALARSYRHAAMESLKRAEAAEQRADAWFTQFAKVSGIYEPEMVVLDPNGSLASMTSAQRRTREAKVMAQLRKAIAAVKEKAEAQRAGVAAGAT